MFDYDESINVEKKVGVAAEKAWEIISMPGSFTHWYPFLEKYAAESSTGIGSKNRHLIYNKGFDSDNDLTGLI